MAKEGKTVVSNDNIPSGGGFFMPMDIAPGEPVESYGDSYSSNGAKAAMSEVPDIELYLKIQNLETSLEATDRAGWPHSIDGRLTHGTIYRIIELIHQDRAATLSRLLEKLDTYTAKHDQPMRDEAKAIIRAELDILKTKG